MRHLVKSAVAIPLPTTGTFIGLFGPAATAAPVTPTGPTSLYAPSAPVLTAAACAELASVAGHFSALGEENGGGFFPSRYDPVVVTATGVRDGRRVRYEHSYGNAW